MISYLDILRKEPLGVMWIGTAATFEDAHSQIRADSSPTLEYIIFNSRTGDCTTVSSYRKRPMTFS
jgi:hypothetical protein